MPHPLERIREQGELYGLWELQRERWNFDQKRHRRQRARNLKHFRRREDHTRLVMGLVVFTALTGEVPTKDEIKSALMPATSEFTTPSSRLTNADIQSLL